MVLYENIFSRALDRKFWLNFKKISYRQPLYKYISQIRLEITGMKFIIWPM